MTDPSRLTFAELAELEQRLGPSLRLTAACSMARRLLELESALEFMARTHVDCLWEDTEVTLRLAREFGWTPPGESK